MTTQSNSDFWQQHELKLSTITYWRNKQSKPRPKLMPVPMPTFEASTELALPGGIQCSYQHQPLSKLFHCSGAYFGSRG